MILLMYDLRFTIYDFRLAILDLSTMYEVLRLKILDVGYNDE